MTKQLSKSTINKIVIALIAVIIIIAVILFYWTNGKSNSNKPIVNNYASSLQRDMAAKMQKKLPAPRNSMLIPSKNEIIGRWLAIFSKTSLAELTLVNGKFELIYTSDPTGKLRKYSKGIYTYNDVNGKIRLYPSKKDGKPKAIKGVTYKSLTNRNYDVLISKSPNGNALYFSALEYQIMQKSFHPLFLYVDYSGAPVIKFSPIKIKKR